MNPFQTLLKNTIKIGGPISIAHFMRSALMHPLGGYYQKGDVFGKKGDFITSPEISQLFGEMVGLFYANTMMKKDLMLVEFGAGRGTLCNDVLRTLQQFDLLPASVHIIETSVKMRELQKETIQFDNINWHDSLDTVPREKGVYLAHEFFDALPIHRFVKVENEWREILVDYENEFCFVTSPGPTNAARIYSDLLHGDEIEICPDGLVIMEALSDRVKQDDSVALIMDYGGESIRSSLRGIRHHQLVHPLSEPGNTDISALVDYLALKKVSKVPFVHQPQRDFLLKMGIEIRCQQLSQANPSQAEALKSQVDRLVDTTGMGTEYKVGLAANTLMYPFIN